MSYQTRMAEDSPDAHIIGLTKVTIDRILKLPSPGDCLALYTFYCYTAKWQNTAAIRCTSEFVKNGLDWGSDRFNKAKKQLLALGLIEDIKARGDGGLVEGWYVRVRFFVRVIGDQNNHSSENPSVDDEPLIGKPTGRKSGDKCLKTGKEEMQYTGREETKSSKSRCTEEEIVSFSTSLGFTENDGSALFCKWEGNGWRNGANPIKDWKATFRCWAKSGWLPSQKTGTYKASSPQGDKPTGVIHFESEGARSERELVASRHRKDFEEWIKAHEYAPKNNLDPMTIELTWVFRFLDRNKKYA